MPVRNYTQESKSLVGNQENNNKKKEYRKRRKKTMKRYDRRSLTNHYFPPLSQLELQDKHADAEKMLLFPPFSCQRRREC
jgi:hypothetical protein